MSAAVGWGSASGSRSGSARWYSRSMRVGVRMFFEALLVAVRERVVVIVVVDE